MMTGSSQTCRHLRGGSRLFVKGGGVEFACMSILLFFLISKSQSAIAIKFQRVLTPPPPPP